MFVPETAAQNSLSTAGNHGLIPLVKISALVERSVVTGGRRVGADIGEIVLRRALNGRSRDRIAVVEAVGYTVVKNEVCNTRVVNRVAGRLIRKGYGIGLGWKLPVAVDIAAFRGRLIVSGLVPLVIVRKVPTGNGISRDREQGRGGDCPVQRVSAGFRRASVSAPVGCPL